MSTWLIRLLVLSGAFFLVGWGLVLVSGYGGNSAGGSELVWRVGGVMVYASVPTLMLAGLLSALSFLCSSARRRCQH